MGLLPELVPKMTSKCRCTGYGSATASCSACRNSRGARPLVPPPSILNTRVVAVAGLTRTAKSMREPHRRQLSTWRSQGSWSSQRPKVRMQVWHVQCEQGRWCRGARRMQMKHVFSEDGICQACCAQVSWRW